MAATGEAYDEWKGGDAVSSRRRQQRGKKDGKKKKDQGLLTFVCLLMCCGPPVVVVGGVLIGQWAAVRSQHRDLVDGFNAAVAQWNAPSRTHVAFADARYTLAVGAGSTAPVTGVLPATLRRSSAPERQHRVMGGVESLESWTPLRYELASAGQGNETGLPLASAFDTRLTLGLVLYEQRADAPGGRLLVAELPPFPIFREATLRTTALSCRSAFGQYNYAAGTCTEAQMADAVCLKLELLGGGSDARWGADLAGGGMGCEASDGWLPVRYKGVFTGTDGRLVNRHTLPVIVRSGASPFVLASVMTGGTLNFENTRADKFALGLTLAIVGCGMSYPWCVMCKRKQSRRQRSARYEAEAEEQQDLVRGRLEPGRRRRRFASASDSTESSESSSDDDEAGIGGYGRRQSAAQSTDPQRSYASYVRARRASAMVEPPPPAQPQRHIPATIPMASGGGGGKEEDDDDVTREFVALATALNVDLATEEHLHDIIYETLLAPLPKPWTSTVRGGVVYYVNMSTGAESTTHPMLRTVEHVITARRQSWQEQQAPPRASSAAAPAARPQASARAPPQPAPSARSSAAADRPVVEEGAGATDAEIFGEFFEAPRNAKTIDQKSTNEMGYTDSWAERQGGAPGGGGGARPAAPSGGGDSGYVDTWALQQEQGPPGAPGGMHVPEAEAAEEVERYLVESAAGEKGKSKQVGDVSITEFDM